MVDENRFAGLADAENSGFEDKTDATLDDTEQETSPTTTSDEGEADKSEHDEGGPAFSFDETTAKSIYVREETLDILEDTELEIELLLRQEHDIRDITGREVMDAVLRVAAENTEAVADQIIAERDGYSDG